MAVAPPEIVAQRFDSALAPAAPLDVRSLQVQVEVAWDSGLRTDVARDVGEIYTRSSGFRAMVAPAAEPSLQVFRGVEDQLVPATRQLNVQVPADAFIHTNANETVQLVAAQADGRPLPRWLRFDGKAGVFVGEPPQADEVDLRVKVVARDSAGREAVVMFRIKSGDSLGVAQRGLSAQLMRRDGLATGVSRDSLGGQSGRLGATAGR